MKPNGGDDDVWEDRMAHAYAAAVDQSAPLPEPVKAHVEMLVQRCHRWRGTVRGDFCRYEVGGYLLKKGRSFYRVKHASGRNEE